VIAALLILLNIFQGSFQSGKEIRIYLEKTFPDYERIEYVIDDKTAGSQKYFIDEEREARLSKNLLLVPVKIVDRKGNASKSFITLRVKLYKTVLVANQEISRDEMLSSIQFRKELKDVALLNGTPVSETDQLTGSRSRNRLKNGTVLVKEMMETIPDILPEDRLLLHAGGNGVDITTEVTAREKGNIGDVIRVISEQKKIFTARIIDKYNVLLIE